MRRPQSRALLRAAIPKVIVPLDLTNDVPLTKSVYLQIANHRPVPVRVDGGREH